ncbi:hypothetical protein GBP346_A3820 [Burkholderia pseudomallei MSHR346]|nr:hypothetical protein GBP346_A3820 [Burkholderia pseudomallei MSHR346]
MVRLQDSNPPPDDYKAPEIINNYNDLEEYRVSKTLVCFGFSALRGKSPRPIGNARTL